MSCSGVGERGDVGWMVEAKREICGGLHGYINIIQERSLSGCSLWVIDEDLDLIPKAKRPIYCSLQDVVLHVKFFNA